MKNFALTGAAGYIAPRHIEAIKESGNNLIVAYDPNDSVGILDRHFQNVQFHKDFESFHYYIHSLSEHEKVDYMSICSPNYFHKYHMAFAMREGMDVICEKPLVLKESDIEDLLKIEQSTGKRVNTVLQLRVHDSIIKLKEKVANDKSTDKFDVELSYFTSRGPWYHQSWKNNDSISGGLASNIGIHLFDMLTWVFGKVEKSEVHISNSKIIAGYLELERARVKWVLSIDKKYLPEKSISEGASTYRSITLDNKEIEFSRGFTGLHNIVYKNILKGNGHGLEDTRSAIKLTEAIRNSDVLGLSSNSHSLLK